MTEAAGRVAVVTGASSGVGRALAAGLLTRGWRVIGMGRDAGRIAAAEAELQEVAGARQVSFVQADLSRMASVEAAARRIAALTDRVHVLANNAGGMPSGMEMTEEGLEVNFAGNHLGPFLLTQRLLPLLRAAAEDAEPGEVRILATSSDGSEMIPAIDLDDLQSLRDFSPGRAYCTGKLANVLFTRALAERLAGEGIVAHAVHPGTVGSNFFSHVSPETRAYTDKLEKLSPEEGADTLLWLATSEQGGRQSGGYWYKRALRKPNPLVEDRVVIDRLWRESEAMIAAAAGPR